MGGGASPAGGAGRAGAVLALGGLTLALASGHALALLRPDQAPPGFDRLAAVHEARAETAAGQRRLDAAARESRSALRRQAPMTAHAWGRIAWASFETDGGFSPRVVEALERSYDVAPFGPDITRWRLNFLLNHWAEAPPGLRDRALEELRVYARRRPGQARSLQDAVIDPGGRMAIALVRAQAGRAATRERRARAAAHVAPQQP